MAHDHTEFVVGERIPGTKYVLCGVLGRGGMGVVYEVVKEPGISGAMKVMYPSMVTRPDCVARFFDEVRLLARLRHKNIVAVHDFDTLRDGTPFLVMEKLEGETLRSTLRKSARSARGFPARGAYEVIRQTCEGLYRAHTQRSPVVHRDIKPENLFLNQLPGSDEVELKVLDFGVAALADSGHVRGQFGTPKYMAPEQFRGEPATPRSDLYAVALVVYEMLTGRLPWDAEQESDVYHAHMFVEPAPLSRFAPWIPKSVDALVAGALARDPAQRPHSVFAFASQLYELQWVDDGHSRAADANTTAPTLTALVSASGEERRRASGSGSGHDTFRGMTTPPIEGASLEVVSQNENALPRETIRVRTPSFSPETVARGLAQPTKVPGSRPSVDRNAPTREQSPVPRPVPKHDTEPLSGPGSLVPPIAECSPPRQAPPPAPPEATPLAAALGSVRRPVRSVAPRAAALGHRQNLLPFIVFSTFVAIGAAASVMATRGPRETLESAHGPAASPGTVASVSTTSAPISVAALTLSMASGGPSIPSGAKLDADASAELSRGPRVTPRPLVPTPPPSAESVTRPFDKY